MDNTQRELLEIVADVRAHLEYQRALGVKSVELPSPETRTAAPAALYPVKASAAGPAVKPISSAPPPPSALDAVRKDLGDCARCKLHSGRKNLVFGEGNQNAALVFVGEGPGAEEDEQGRPFVGAAGQLLTDIIVKGMKLKREDVYICNIVKCRPPNNRNPEPDEITACEPFLIKQLQAIKPKVIIGLGNVACKTLLKTDEGITKLRGQWKTYQNILLMPTFHPAYLLRVPKDKALVWKDVQQVMEKLNIEL